MDLIGSRVLVAVVEHDSVGSDRERSVGVSAVMRSEVAIDHLGQIDVGRLNCYDGWRSPSRIMLSNRLL